MLPGPIRFNVAELCWFSRNGGATVLAHDRGGFADPRVSPEGSRDGTKLMSTWDSSPEPPPARISVIAHWGEDVRRRVRP